MTTNGGALVVVGTPIGNLGDLSSRAAAALADADTIACEDTRRCRKLLQHLGIERPRLVVVNEHTEFGARDVLLDAVAAGSSVVLVSDAGMPAVSDPGHHLVSEARRRGLPVDVVPGPTAAITALVSSGLASDRFVFEGFLPRRGLERRRRLSALETEPRTSIVFESPHRLAATLADLVEVCGSERQATVARELTKLHQEVVTAPLGELSARFAAGTKGEVVVVVAPAPTPDERPDGELLARVQSARSRGLSTRDAVSEVVAATGASKRRVYALAVDPAAAAGGTADTGTTGLDAPDPTAGGG